MQYVQDYDELLPSAWNGHPQIDGGQPMNWGWAVQPYVKSRQIFLCPNETQKNGNSFLMNNSMGQQNLARVSSPADTVVFMEGSVWFNGDRDMNNANTGYGLNGDFTIWDSVERQIQTRGGLPRHTDRNIQAFSDGHAKVSGALKGTSAWPIPAECTAALEGSIPYLGRINPNHTLDGAPQGSWGGWNPGDSM